MLDKVQLAAYLRVAPNTIARSLNNGEWQDMPHYRIGKRGDLRFKKDEVTDYLLRKFN